jgi:hydrogenase nickel incorporation protein HypA/HybF
MHEFSICQSLVRQVENLAVEHGASRVLSIHLRIGPLSGIEPQLLASAFQQIITGSAAESAQLQLTQSPIRVHCLECGADTEALINRLVCGKCGHWRTRLLSGDEMLLESVEFE